MNWFAKKSKHTDQRVGVGVDTDGIAVARLCLRAGEPPALLAADYAETAEEPTDSLKALVRKHRLGDADCNLVIQADNYAVVLVETPEVPADELRAAVRWKIRDLIDFHVDDAVIDVFEIPNDKAGRKQMMYAVAAPISLVRARIELAKAAHLRLRTVDIADLAQRNIAAQLPEDVAGVALLYLHPNAGLVTLTRQRTLYLARHLDMGLNGLGPLSSEHSDGPPPQAIGWLNTLVVEIQRSLDYFESNFAQAPIKSLVIAPLVRQIPGMTQYLSEQLGISARLLDLQSVIDTDQDLDITLQARCFPAIGAALRHEEQRL